MKKIHNRFKDKIQRKKFLALIAAAGSNISKEKYIQVLMTTFSEMLENEFKGIIEENNDLQMTYACIVAIGNIVIHSLSNTPDLVLIIANFVTP